MTSLLCLEMKRKRELGFLDLPIDIQRAILSKLLPKDLLNASLTNKYLDVVFNSDDFRRQYIHADPGRMTSFIADAFYDYYSSNSRSFPADDPLPGHCRLNRQTWMLSVNPVKYFLLIKHCFISSQISWI